MSSPETTSKPDKVAYIADLIRADPYISDEEIKAHREKIDALPGILLTLDGLIATARKDFVVPIDDHSKFRGLSFKLMLRKGDVAIFEVINPKGEKIRTYYEVILIQRCEEHTWPNGHSTPAHEFYPKDDTWGRLGWTATDWEQARKIFDREVKKHENQTTPTPRPI